MSGLASNSQDKYIISEYYTFDAPSREMILEAEKNFQPIVMSGILQKADTLNKNGRIYPYDILKREADKYMELIKENVAGGELDHPDCHSFDTKILTEFGWMNFTDLKGSEKVVTLNSDTNEIELELPKKHTHEHYKGKMFQFKGRNFDQLVTPNHRFWITNSNGKGFFKTAQELFEYRSNKWKISKRANWEGEKLETVTLPALEEEKYSHAFKRHDFRRKYSEPININPEDWFAFMGMYLADGTSTGVCGGKSNKSRFVTKITQKKEESKKEIEKLLNRLPFSYRTKYYENGKVDYIIVDIRVFNHCKPLGNSHTKFIPSYIKNASSELLETFFKWFKMGDGTNKTSFHGDKSYTSGKVFSTSRTLIYDLHEVLLKIGGSGNITTEQPKDRYIKDVKVVKKEMVLPDGTVEVIEENISTKRLIEAKNSKTKYLLNLSTCSHVYLDKRNLTIEEVDYNDTVHCVTTDNGIIYTMRNGKSAWGGNSAVVSLANVSHRVVDMWWEGKELWGRVQIAETAAGNTLKGLLKTGFKLGISSRGVGSVKSSGDRDIVQDDFELIAFDYVSNPSTPGAYLFKEGHMRPFKSDLNQAKTLGEINRLKLISQKDFWKSM